VGNLQQFLLSQPQNILARTEGASAIKSLHICDFGIAKYCEGETGTIIGTLYYMAPEVNSGSYDPFPADSKCHSGKSYFTDFILAVYSFGVVMLQLMGGDYRNHQQLPSVGEYQPLVEILKKCLQQNPKMRPTASVLL